MSCNPHIHHLPVTSYPDTIYQLPVTKCQLPNTRYQLPFTTYHLPCATFCLPHTPTHIGCWLACMNLGWPCSIHLGMANSSHVCRTPCIQRRLFWKTSHDHLQDSSMQQTHQVQHLHSALHSITNLKHALAHAMVAIE